MQLYNMRKIILLLAWALIPFALGAQKVLTPEALWSLGRLGVIAQSPDGKTLLYSVSTTDITTEKSAKQYFLLDIATGQSKNTTILEGAAFVQWDKNGLYVTKGNELKRSQDNGATWTTIITLEEGAENIRIAPDGNWTAYSKTIPSKKVLGNTLYADVPNSTAKVFTDLNYRHWDTWSDGTIAHVFVASLNNPRTPVKDILQNEPYDCPQKPFGGSEDFIFTADSKSIIYVCKKKVGKEYAQSTNTDLYMYDISDGKTKNLTEGMMGYDVSPILSPDGSKLAWLSMKRDGYEADKNDIVVMDMKNPGIKLNLTAGWDETVDGGFQWSKDGKSIYYNAAMKGSTQLFVIDVPANLMVRMQPQPRQITKGDFDVTGVVAQQGKSLLVTRTDFNHATELYTVDITKGTMQAVSHVNDAYYNSISLSDAKLRMVTTTDGKQMGVWVIYPPNFDPNKKYPTLLYCQGGPQSAVTPFYSVRWNFQLMAAQGYIVVAPNRRGLPGWGVAWNEAISGDWGGQPMKDYLSAIDDVAKESYVDKNRLGCVGASYGGYSVFMLAGIHNNRFKSFIAHNGLFDMKSWYGTTEELWFANWDLGGNYWTTPTPKSYTQFNPSNYIDKWTTPIMIIQGEIDFRVPIGQGLAAFQAAQLKGIKSKLLFYPNENHWVLHAHNGLVWQREFFSWLKETL
jgi:dipeptidyl aminopeptidase/acylaminoacyl peptidase